MTEAVRNPTEAPLVTGEGAYSEEYTALCAGYPAADSLRHACIAIFGPQSSGKSTLLNDLFGTRFETLNVARNGQQQTTRGITAGIISSTESSPTILLLDCEGSESGERAVVADQNIERRIGAFASVTADVLIVNILQTDVGRAEGSCSNLLRSIFGVYFQLRNSQDGLYHRLKLFIAVRRCNEKGEEKMKASLFNKVRNIYEESVPLEFRERFNNFIDLDFWFIRDKFCEDEDGNRQESKLYKKQIGDIRTQLSALIAEAVQQPASSGRLPLALAESPDPYRTIWGRICRNEDLDIPSMQEALSTKRCIEIATGCTEQFDTELTNLDVPVPASPQDILAAKLDPMRFVQSCADAASDAALSFDKQTEGYVDGPRAQQREALHQHIRSRLEDKAARVARSIRGAAAGIMSSVSQNVQKLLSDWDGEAPLTGPDDAAVALAGAVEELDAVYAAHRDGPLLRVRGLFHDPGFFHNRFIDEMDLPQQPSGEGVYGSLSGLHASLLSWCVKLSAPLGVLCGVGETVAESRSTLENLLDKTRQAMREAVERAGLAHLQCTGARVRSALSNTSASPQAVLAALYNDLIGESQARVRHAAEALGWRGFPADGALPKIRETLLSLVQQEVELFVKNDAVGVLAQAMDAAFVRDGAELRSYESEDSAAARYSEVREGLEAYVRSLGTVRLEGGEVSVPGEQIDEVLKRADDEWGKMHSSIMERLRVRQENQKLREMHEQASTKLNRQREQIKVLEESIRQQEAEMDQQREETERRQKKLDEALKGANNEIASLEKELATKSTRVDTLEQQLADAIKKSDKLNQLVLVKDSSWTPLMCAAFLGDIETAKQHLSDKDKKNNKGETAMILAARAGHENIVELLDPTDENGVTALMRAAERGDVEAVKALIPLHKGKTARYVKINGWKIYEGTALIIAAVCGHTEMVKLLVKYENGIKDEDGRTALVHAARNGHREIAELLMEHEKDVTGWTMLMCATVLGDVEMVSQHLGKRGQKDKRGWTALIFAAEYGRDDAVRLLMKYESGVSSWTNLIYAAYLGDINAVRDNLHEKGCKDIIGMTALMWAAYRGRREVVRILVEEEGGMQRNDGWTALMWAARENKADCIRVLLDKEAGMQAENGWTALMFAAYNGHSECARLLARKEKGMKTTHEWNGYPSGTTALDIAKREGHTEIVSILSG